MATQNDFEPGEDEIKRRNLEYLSSELDRLHQYCVDSDIDSFKTRTAAEPFLKWHEKSRKSCYICSLFTLSLILAVFAVVVSHEPLYKYFTASTRKLNTKLLPWVDWTSLYKLRCVISNPFENSAAMILEEEDCDTCSNVTSIRQFQHINMEDLCDTYLDNSIPMVLNNQNVYRNGRTSVADIRKMYLEDEILHLYACCEFSSNIQKDVTRQDHRVFLRHLQKGRYTQYYAHWQNCFREAAKLFRKLYNRPAFLPSSVELSPHNWLLISSNYAEDQSIQVPINSSVIILIQISGSLDVIAEAKELCQSDCKSLGVRLQPRSILIAPTFLYNYKYRPSTDGSSITVGLEGSIDL